MGVLVALLLCRLWGVNNTAAPGAFSLRIGAALQDVIRVQAEREGIQRWCCLCTEILISSPSISFMK